jgi:hypothetical protein
MTFGPVDQSKSRFEKILHREYVQAQNDKTRVLKSKMATAVTEALRLTQTTIAQTVGLEQVGFHSHAMIISYGTIV